MKKKFKKLFMQNWNGDKTYSIKQNGPDQWLVRFENVGIGCNVMQLFIVHDMLVLNDYKPREDSAVFEHDGYLVK